MAQKKTSRRDKIITRICLLSHEMGKEITKTELMHDLDIDMDEQDWLESLFLYSLRSWKKHIPPNVTPTDELIYD